MWRYESLLVVFGQCRSAWRQAVHSFRRNCVVTLHDSKFVHARNDQLSFVLEPTVLRGVCARACIGIRSGVKEVP